MLRERGAHVLEGHSFERGFNAIARRESWDDYVEGPEVLVRRVGVNCDRRLWDLVDFDDLNGETLLRQLVTIEAEKRLVLDDRHNLGRLTLAGWGHAPQSAS